MSKITTLLDCLHSLRISLSSRASGLNQSRKSLATRKKVIQNKNGGKVRSIECLSKQPPHKGSRIESYLVLNEVMHCTMD